MKKKLFDGKTVLITGGAGGIGWGIATEFTKEGANVIVTDIDQERGAEVIQKLKKIGGSHEFKRLDVSDISRCSEVVAEIYRSGKQIDVLINNAGVNTSHNFLEMTPEAWDKVININLRGHLFLSQAVARKMVENKQEGVILFISSVHQDVTQGHPHYSASKAAIKMLVREIAVELAPHRIRVVGIAPGGIYIDKRINDPSLANDEPTVLLGGKNGIPRDIGRAAVMLASSYWSRHITGETLTVSGGQYLQPK